MKTLYTIIAALGITSMAYAQIPNASFDSWTGSNPTGWVTSNDASSNGDSSVTKSTNAHTGAFSVKLQGSVVGAFIAPSSLIAGTTNQPRFAVSSTPMSLHGWYIGHPTQSGDQLQFVVGAIPANPSGTSIGGGVSATLTDAPSVYKEFAINLLYSGTAQADSANISISFYNNNGSLGVGSYYILDDLSFSNSVATGINEVNDMATLEACSPNPASSIANIIYTIKENSSVTVNLFDVVGHQVSNLLSSTQQTPGRYKIPMDVSALPNGVYFYNLNVNGQSYTQKLIVSK